MQTKYFSEGWPPHLKDNRENIFNRNITKGEAETTD